MFGAAPAAATPGTMAQAPTAQAQALCQDLAKRMEDLYPVLQQASGQPPAAGVAPSALQQGFVAYTYSTNPNPQFVQQANAQPFNPQQHLDPAKWVQAKQNNPDPSSCYVEQLVGLTMLENRATMQQKAVEDCNSELEKLRSGFGNLKDALQAQSMQKLEECRRRHQMLSRQLLQVVSSVEGFAAASGAGRRDPMAEAQLEGRLARLEEAVNAPASARPRLEELFVVLRNLLQRGAPNGGVANLSDAEAEKTLKLTASQGELLETLQEEITRRKRDITQFENALTRFTTNGAAVAQTI